MLGSRHPILPFFPSFCRARERKEFHQNKRAKERTKERPFIKRLEGEAKPDKQAPTSVKISKKTFYSFCDDGTLPC